MAITRVGTFTRLNCRPVMRLQFPFFSKTWTKPHGGIAVSLTKRRISQKKSLTMPQQGRDCSTIFEERFVVERLRSTKRKPSPDFQKTNFKRVLSRRFWRAAACKHSVTSVPHHGCF